MECQRQHVCPCDNTAQCESCCNACRSAQQAAEAASAEESQRLRRLAAQEAQLKESFLDAVEAEKDRVLLARQQGLQGRSSKPKSAQSQVIPNTSSCANRCVRCLVLDLHLETTLLQKKGGN